MLADRIFFINVKIDDLQDWEREALTVCLGAKTPAELPITMDYVDLSEISNLAWVGFENVISVTDRCAACSLLPATALVS